LCRKGGVVAVVGAVGMELDRRVFYANELQVRMCTSYGPGRYDPVYEERGTDYPYPYVRWTEGRNLDAVLALMASGALDVEPLLTHAVPLENAAEAYALVRGERAEPFLGILLSYPDDGDSRPARASVPTAVAARASGDTARLGVIGAGQFAGAVLLPALKALAGVQLEVVASSGGVTAESARRHFGFARVAASHEDVLASDDVDAVIVNTRHDSHAALVAAALRAGKPCFVEKPLAIRRDGLDDVLAAMAEHPGLVCVGFNRRFAPGVTALRERLSHRTSPLHARYRVNAGKLPASHWTLDLDVGGGRVLGECCHFLDLLAFIASSPVQRVQAESVGADGVIALLRHADGSTSVLDYGTTGDASLPKELLEVHWEGTSLLLDDFRSLSVHQGGRTQQVWSGAQDKGHRAELALFVKAVQSGGASPVPFDESVATTRTAFAVVAAAAGGRAVDVLP
jgi:predicted dehydrogenase